MKFLLLVAFLVSASLSQAGTADIPDGNWLAEGIRAFRKVEAQGDATNDEAIKAIAASEFLRGFLCGSLMWSRLDPDCSFKLPEPHGIPSIQLIRIMEKFFADHPEQLHQPAEALVFMAILDSFPNPAKKKH